MPDQQPDEANPPLDSSSPQSQADGEDDATTSSPSSKTLTAGKLAGDIAHEFNNLILVVSAAAHVLLASLPSDAQARPSVVDISEAGLRGAELTRKLLWLSRRREMNSIHLDVNDFANEVEGEVAKNHTTSPDQEADCL